MEPLIIHPASYIDIQIRPAIQENDRSAEIVWTYLVARKYENDHQALVSKLCGPSESCAKESKIWLEAYLQPTRRNEGDSWKTRADLAIGHIKKIANRENQIQSSGGEWICIVESKWYDDIHLSAADYGINQLSQIIDHALLLHDSKGDFPKSVYVTLLTPRYFKERLGEFSYREYSIKYTEYKKEPDKLKADLMRCQFPFLKHDVETLISRIGALKLNWVTFEELLDLPNLVEDQRPGKYRVTFDSWLDIFLKMGREDLSVELSSNATGI